MEKSWIGHGKVMERSWKSHGKVMDRSWKSHGKVMDMFEPCIKHSILFGIDEAQTVEIKQTIVF